MDKRLSIKLKLVTFLLICMAVVHHANLVGFSTGWLETFQIFMTEGVTRLNIPFFFVMSGFLLMYNYDGNAFRFFVRKIVKRGRSILVPLMAWTLVVLSILYLSAALGMEALTGDHSSFSFSIREVIDEMFVYPTVCYQYWFLISLMKIVLISPLLYLGLRVFRHWWLFILLVSMEFYPDFLGFVSVYWVLYYSCGMYLAMYKREWAQFQWQSSRPAVVVLFIIWLAMCLYQTFVPINGAYWSIVRDTSGALMFWGIMDLCPERFFLPITGIAKYSFFLYLAHEPTLTVLKKTGLMLLSRDLQINILLIYIVAPVLTIIVCVSLAHQLAVRLPVAYSFMCGGRIDRTVYG